MKFEAIFQVCCSYMYGAPMVLWCVCMVLLWCCGVYVWCSYGAVVCMYGAPMVLWCVCMVLLWCCGVYVWCSCGAVVCMYGAPILLSGPATCGKQTFGRESQAITVGHPAPDGCPGEGEGNIDHAPILIT